MKEFKIRLKQQLQDLGWFLRKVEGLSDGIDLALDLKRKLQMRDPVVFDVGAHRGETVEYFLTAFPRCRIISFEPVPESFSILASRFGSDPRVVLEECALGQEQGQAVMTLRSDSMTNSLATTPEARLSGSAQSIHVSTVDHMRDAHSVPTIDILKIDVEGFETQVLRGAEQSLKGNAIRTILCEFTLDPDDQAHTQLWELLELIHLFGYKTVGIYDQSIWSDPIRMGHGNILFGRVTSQR